MKYNIMDKLFLEFCALIEDFKIRYGVNSITVDVLHEVTECPDPFTFWQYCNDNNVYVNIRRD